MTEEEKIRLLNRIADGNYSYSGPASLFKYRPFDQYTFDMLEKGYVFLCPAKNLDDPTECVVTASPENIYDVEHDCVRRECVDQILEMIHPYTSEENFQEAKSLIYQAMTPDFRMRNHFLLDSYPQLQSLAPDANLAPLINMMANFPEQFDKPETKEKMARLIQLGLEAREKIGICSLAESPEIEYMWKNYANASSGYCIEYDIQDYANNGFIFPVIYREKKETDIVTQIVATFLGQMIRGMTYDQIEADRSQFIRLFVTKDLVWDYQKEWRLLGDANFHAPAPKIKRVVLGEDVLDQDKKAMSEFCESHEIELAFRRSGKAIVNG